MPVNQPDHAIMGALQERWSPYRFAADVVEDEKLLSCLEAARWAASSFNDQPWYWIVARRQDEQAFQTALGCLMEANQPWAANAGVLILTVTRSGFAYNGKPNRVALHDLGQASAYLALQATELGLQVHQMAGINISVIRQQYAVPEGHEPQTAIAIGYPDASEPSDELSAELKKRESGPRSRKQLSDQVFGSKWGSPADFLG